VQSTTGNSTIQLSWHNEDGLVVVTPQDQDRYTLTVRSLIERERKGKQLELFNDQLRLLLRELATWLEGRENVVSQAYLTMRDGGFLFLVVKKDAEYSDQLEDELSELDIKLANDKLINALEVDVLALPNASSVAVDTFIDPAFVFRFYEE